MNREISNVECVRNISSVPVPAKSIDAQIPSQVATPKSAEYIGSMKPFIPALVLLSLSLLFYACQKDNRLDAVENPVKPEVAYDGKKVQASFQGRVLKENGDPVAGAKVTIGTASTVTDQYGVFTLADVETDDQFGYVKAEKTGYLAGSRTVVTRPESMNFVEIRLIKKTLKGSFGSADAATVTVDNAVTLRFSDHSIVTQANEPYTGKVNVYATVIDPSAANFSGIMPGDLRGIRTNNEITAMVSYGMVSVELEGESGQKLQLRDGKKATISMEIPASLRGAAPSSIAMWHFDEAKGYWVEEGAGIKNGSTYVGEVAHFSTWNFDEPSNFIRLALELVADNDQALAYKEVKIYDATNNGYYNSAFTDSSGAVQMWVPAGTELKLKVVGSCDQALDSTVVGPFTADVNLGAVTLRPSAGILIKGQLVDCNAAPVGDGIVKLSFQGLNYAVRAANGEFTLSLDQCLYGGSAKAQLKAENATTLQQSEVYDVNVVPGVNDVGKLLVCSAIDTSLLEFIQVKIGSTEYTYNSIVDSLINFPIAQYTFIRVYGSHAGPYIYSRTFNLELPDTIPGTYIVNSGSYTVGPDSIAYNATFSLNHDDERYRLLLSDTIIFNITKYGQPGDMIEATFTADVIKPGIVDVKIPASGKLRIRRWY